jgi:hypothetical protein
MTALSMGDFAARLIWHVQCGGMLDETSLREIRRSCVNDLKNSECRGATFEQQAEILNGALTETEKLIDLAIYRGHHDPDKTANPLGG